MFVCSAGLISHTLQLVHLLGSSIFLLTFYINEYAKSLCITAILMSQTSVSSSDNSWEELRCPLDDYVEPHDDDTYYDDTRPGAPTDNNADTIEDYAQDSYPYDPERDNPLRHEGVPEEKIAKVVANDFRPL